MKNPLSWYDDVLVIDRAHWRNGGMSQFHHGVGATQLLNRDGFQCCLGFAAEQLGCSRDLLLNAGMPFFSCLAGTYLQHEDGRYKPFVYNIDSTKRAAVIINDDPNTTRSCKELELFMLGKKHRIFVKFVGEYTN